MTDEPQTLGRVLRETLKSELWAGGRRVFTVLWIAGGALLTVAYFGLDFAKDNKATPLALTVFCVSVAMVAAGIMGHQVMDLPTSVARSGQGSGASSFHDLTVVDVETLGRTQEPRDRLRGQGDSPSCAQGLRGTVET